ncbi:hypothetical protein H6P81_004015 [Aristolochia fimbriata]|uniref:COBRA C-terminal domain-containing protein n=1 Tax=Aristolochia fimbriata TaxID=158543 RepID=A0AAV7FH21_ARIFI|nr:hypothetical protein H6P81_004015 [Aristolochia fimbriata]
MARDLHILLLLFSVFIPISLSQAPAPAQDACNGIFLSYLYKQGARIRPFLSDPKRQPYSFKSTATILNAGDVPLKSWDLFIGFQHDEILVSSSPAILTDGTTLPAPVGNGTFFSGFPNSDLKTAIETAGDVNQIQVQIDLVGTQFGVRPPTVPLPSNISLANDGYKCPTPTKQGTNFMYVCCVRDPKFKANLTEEDDFLPRRDGDLIMYYDVLQSFASNYMASVTISNNNPLGRLDNWKLNWEWMRGEFIFDMKGAYTSKIDFSECGLQSTTSAIATWQVVCNITQPKGSKPRCCVSFSAFYNDSVIPCETCACGCPSSMASACSTRQPALLLPPDALLVPFDNRTQKALAWADLKHFRVPKPLPCGDMCGVSINWHVATDYRRGWTARITLFNWGDTSFGDWFTAVQLDKAYPGYEAMYSFNGSTLPDVNNTVFMQGLPGLNFLIAESDGANPSKDPPVPGKQQTVISFKKKATPGINVVSGDGFPSKVFFNGEECSLPSTLPTSDGHMPRIQSWLSLLLILAGALFVLLEQ